MEHIEELVQGRRSVRTYDEREIEAELLKKFTDFMGEIKNPYGVPVTFRLLDGRQQPLKCPVAVGTHLFVGAKAPRVPHMEEAVGFSMETLILYAQSLGLGSVWVGGTMDRPTFERAMELGPEERMPCMSPLGYPAGKMSVRESLMRKGIKADSREAFETLFFDSSFDTPLTAEKAGALAHPLEMVRWAPSAVNKQPWRVVLCGKAAHFYLKHSKGFVSEQVGDMQKIDLGIALCHFAMDAEERGLAVRFCLDDPGLPAGPDTEYIASYRMRVCVI